MPQPRLSAPQRRTPSRESREEVKQLAAYLAARAQAVDRDIDAYRAKLKLVTMPALHSKRPELSSGTSSAFLTDTRRSVDQGVSTDILDDEADVLRGPGAGVAALGTKITKFDSGVAPEPMSSLFSFPVASHASPLRHESASTTSHSIIDNFFFRMRRQMNELSMSASELVYLLLPGDNMSADTFLPVAELLEVLQVDLLLPVTDREQAIILAEFGDGSEVDIKAMLECAGLWADDKNASPAKHNAVKPLSSSSKVAVLEALHKQVAALDLQDGDADIHRLSMQLQSPEQDADQSEADAIARALERRDEHARFKVTTPARTEPHATTNPSSNLSAQIPPNTLPDKPPRVATDSERLKKELEDLRRSLVTDPNPPQESTDSLSALRDNLAEFSSERTLSARRAQASVKKAQGYLAIDSLASACERRLAFEIASAPSPHHTLTRLIQALRHLASPPEPSQTESFGPFISTTSLSEAFRRAGLGMSDSEVLILAKGFASDGKGGVKVDELVDAVRGLVSDHAKAKALEEQWRRDAELEEAAGRETEERLRVILEDICLAILAQDRFAEALLDEDEVFRALLKPFFEADAFEIGALGLRDLFYSVKELCGVSLSGPDLAFLASQYASLLPASADNREKVGVLYQPLVSALSKELVRLSSEQGAAPGTYDRSVLTSRRPGSSTRQLLLREFDITDSLLSQLASLAPAERRRSLTALHYALTSADKSHDGEVDGFAMLQALLGAGFRLPRVSRARLLSAVEAIGGRLEWAALLSLLQRAAPDWHEERGVVRKILTAMGVSVSERRIWLARLRNALERAALRTSGHQRNIDARINDDPGVSPASFLRLLRESGVSLSVEEEAVLLDGLDMEHSARVAFEYAGLTRVNPKLTSHLNAWTAPLVYYKPFLTLCSRHAGQWADSQPKLREAIRKSVEELSRPEECLSEFSSLLTSFDDIGEGCVTKRAFLVASRRSRLLGGLRGDELEALAEALTQEGGGKVQIKEFTLYLKSVLALSTRPSLAVDGAPAVTLYGLLQALLAEAQDSRGALLPLRSYLLRHGRHSGLEEERTSDALLGEVALSAVLKQFCVEYSDEAFDGLCKAISVDDISGSTEREYSSKKLLELLIEARGSWVDNLPALRQRIVELLARQGAREMGAQSAQPLYLRSLRGVESAFARKVFARLRAYAFVSEPVIPTLETEVYQPDYLPSQRPDGLRRQSLSNRFVEKGVFRQVLHSMGLPLTEEELVLLSDATDPSPQARMIRIDVVTEALAASQVKREPSQDENSAEALRQVRAMLWKAAKSFGRSDDEWRDDVTSLIRGFDTGLVNFSDKTQDPTPLESGLISTEDLSLGLAVLGCPVSIDLLRGIPVVPDGPGLVAYRPLLTQLLGESLKPDSSANRDLSHTASSDERKKHSYSNTPAQDTAVLGGKSAPLQRLLDATRKELATFLTSDAQVEHAWTILLRAFSHFDPNESDRVSAKDFCLAVSLLLKEHEVALAQDEWLQIFAELTAHDQTSRHATSHIQDIDYLLFCEMVLDKNEVKKLQRDEAASKLSNPTRRPLRREAHSVQKKEIHVREGAMAGLSVEGRHAVTARKRAAATVGKESRAKARAGLSTL